jgi:hypothetical protein
MVRDTAAAVSRCAPGAPEQLARYGDLGHPEDEITAVVEHEERLVAGHAKWLL